MSFFPLCMRAGHTFAAFGPFSKSVVRLGTICQDSP